MLYRKRVLTLAEYMVLKRVLRDELAELEEYCRLIGSKIMNQFHLCLG